MLPIDLFRLFILFAASLVAYDSVLAATYRWVDKNGKVQYSDVMPQSMAGESHVELDKQGRVIKKVPRTRLTPEERQSRIDAAARAEEIERNQIEQRRRDMALLSTYATVNEIALARDRAIELESLNIRGLQTRMDSSAAKLAEANQRLSRFRESGQAAPAAITQMRSEAQRELAQISAAMEQRTRAVEALHRRFEEDEKRFLELKAATR